jgi:hypothetical protein
VLLGALVGLGCGGSDYDLRVTTTMTVELVSGTGVSPLDPLAGQVITFSITFAPAARGYDPVNGCPTTTYGQMAPAKLAAGATAPTVQTEVLDLLPYWEAVISACDPASGSSATLRSDNEAGLGLIFGCHDLAPSLLVLDAQQHAQWSTFVETTNCDATLYDQLHGRLFAGSNMTMQFEAP